MSQELEIVLISHRARRDEAGALADELGRQVALEDVDIPVRVYEDNGFYGEWKNHRRAIVAALERGTASHVVVIQDDAVPIPSFVREARKAVAIRPDDIISFYVGTGRPYQAEVRQAVEEAKAAGVAWLEARRLFWGVAVVYPVVLVPAMMKRADKMPGVPYDERMGAALSIFGKKIFYTWPSLVDHIDGPTVIKGRVRAEPTPRRAWEVGKPNWKKEKLAVPISVSLLDAL